MTDSLDKDAVSGLCGYQTEAVCKNCQKPVTFPAAYDGMCSQCWMWANGHTDRSSK